MIDILECTLRKAVELAIHFMDANTQIAIFENGKLIGVRTLQDLENHKDEIACMFEDFGYIDRVEISGTALAFYIRSY